LFLKFLAGVSTQRGYHHVRLSTSASPVYTAAGFVKCCETAFPGSQLSLNSNCNRSWEHRRMWRLLPIPEAS